MSNNTVASKPRTLQQLAQEALAVQSACNLSGVVNSFVRVLADLRQLPEAEGNDWLHAHPITRVWADKIASLTGIQHNTSAADIAFNEVARLAK